MLRRARVPDRYRIDSARRRADWREVARRCRLARESRNDNPAAIAGDGISGKSEAAVDRRRSREPRDFLEELR